MKKLLVSLLAILGITIGTQAQKEALSTGIQKTLDQTVKLHISANNGFLVNLIYNDTVILQLVHSSLIPQVKKLDNSFNFAFNVTFDNEPKKEEAFKQLDIFNSFTFIETGGVPTYAYNAGTDTKAISSIALTILDKVYGYKSDSQFEYEIHFMGKL